MGERITFSSVVMELLLIEVQNFGGSETTTLECLALLLMTLGVKEGVRYLERF